MGRKWGGEDKDTQEGCNKKNEKERQKIKGSRYRMWYKMVRDSGEAKQLEKIEKGSGWVKMFRLRMREGVMESKQQIDEQEWEEERQKAMRERKK